MSKKPTVNYFKPNNNLPFIIENWEGNPIDAKGRFKNLDEPSVRSFREFYKWIRNNNPYKSLKKDQKNKLDFRTLNDLPEKNKNCLVWLGHASFLIQINGLRILIDPVLFGVGYLKRYIPLPIDSKKLKDIDIIFVTHNHRDHCDAKSIKLLSKLNPNAEILCGLNMGSLIKSWAKNNTIIEMGWYQRFSKDELLIDYLPARHWSRRGLNDTNKMLWGSVMITHKNFNIYYGSDSGLGIHFQDLMNFYGEVEVAILGIGAFEPEWFMAAAHTSPAGALQAASILNAKKLIPMHYGCFDLSDEPVYYPYEVLQKLIPAAYCNVNCLKVGEEMNLEIEN